MYIVFFPHHFVDKYIAHQHVISITYLIPSPSLCPTLRGDKMSMSTHTHPHKPPWKNKWPSAIIRLTAHFMCGLMSDLVIFKHRKEHGRTQHRMSLLKPSVIKQHKPNPLFILYYPLSFLTNYMYVSPC